MAQGKQDPREPRLFLHEYKRELEAAGDPLCQLLIAMVDAQRRYAQQENTEPLPIYTILKEAQQRIEAVMAL